MENKMRKRHETNLAINPAPTPTPTPTPPLTPASRGMGVVVRVKFLNKTFRGFQPGNLIMNTAEQTDRPQLPGEMKRREAELGSHGWMDCLAAELNLSSTLRASLSGTFLQTLPDLVTPLKGHSLSPSSCPPTRSAPFEMFGY